MPTEFSSTRPGLPVGNTCRPLVIHRTYSEAALIHRCLATARRNGLQLPRWCHDSTTAFTHPLYHSVTYLLRPSRAARPSHSARKRNATRRAVAVAHGRAGARRRRIRPTCPRLASRAAWRHGTVSGTIPGVRVLFGDRHYRGSRGRPGRHLNSSRRRWPHRLVDISARHTVRCCWRSR